MSGWSKITETKIKFLFFPITLFYWGVIFWRNIFYNFNFFVSRKIPTKVISVGNITAGGTGKTPAVIYLSQIFKKRNYKVAVLSRGYGRKTAGTQLVTAGKDKVLDWRNFGDEPTLISQKLEDIPIVVDQNRHRGAMYLIEKFNPDIIIMDDAFQHRSIERDLDLVLLNSQAPISDYRLIPHGLLREPIRHLKRADAIILTKFNLGKPEQKLISKVKKS
ncbi:MAG: tetraacyldisaccharide 4'-kinase, partial [Candidatus Marinimicrobia bacterium]|nr:tetraacyldisaccharide 4'-kinase [Candidatus Neomarinimicrobiota bacterium]